MEVTVNMNGIFARIENAKELKETANSIMQQIKAAYDARLVELMPAKVEATPSTKGTKAAPKYKKQTAKSEFAGVPEADAENKKKTAPKQSKSTKETAKTDTKPVKVEQIKIASLTKKQINAMKIHFEQYNEKCMLIVGETKPIKEDIKSTCWARWHNERKGWIVSNDGAQTLAKALKIKLA